MDLFNKWDGRTKTRPSVNDEAHAALLESVANYVRGFGAAFVPCGVEHTTDDQIRRDILHKCDALASRFVRARNDAVIVYDSERALLVDAKTSGRQPSVGKHFCIELLPFILGITHESLGVNAVMVCQWGTAEFAIFSFMHAAKHADGVLFPAFANTLEDIQHYKGIWGDKINGTWMGCSGGRSGDPFVRLPYRYINSLPDWRDVLRSPDILNRGKIERGDDD